MQQIKLAVKLLCLVMSLSLSNVASADPCPPSPSIMASVWTDIAATWEPSGGKTFAIKDLFRVDSLCSVSCHLPSHNTETYKFAGTRYRPCGTCHTGKATGGTYPDWLDFSDLAKMKRASYYSPGLTKAEASLLRATDGTMPPGSYPSPSGLGTAPADRKSHGWCDEITATYRTWIANGYPAN